MLEGALANGISVFFLLVACFLLYMLYSLHLGIGHAISVFVAQLMQRNAHKIEVLFDRTPPTAPQSLIGGPAPPSNASQTITTVLPHETYNGTL